MRYGQHRQRELGVVSLLTVIFFMIFISLIVVGFTTMVVADQRQTIDNDLSASALAAARSGIEDGKRILLYCQQNPSATGCTEAINSQDNCDAFNGATAAHQLAMNLPVAINNEGEGATGGATEYEQYFTCLTIQTKTPTVSTTLSAGTDYIQRLKTVTPFTQLKVTWSGDGTYLDRTGTLSGGWPSLSSWNSSQHMPVIRLQTIPYTSLADLNAVEAATKTVYIVPCKTTTCLPVGGDLTILDMRSGVSTPSGGLRSSGQESIAYADCPAAVGTSYTCTVTLSGYDSSTTQYYVRASALYTTTTKLTLSAADGTGSVLFDNVQPWIDATGRTNDVFKRVRAEVSYTSNVIVPTNALNSAAPICKDMIVTNAAASSTYNCN